jgi:dienelactone hydrolase
MAVTGNLYPFIRQQANAQLPALSFLQERFSDIGDWRATARETLRSLLLMPPAADDLHPELVDHIERDDFIQQKWYFSASSGERVPLLLLRPRYATGPLPAIVALHDHSGIYYFGKKKLVEEENEPFYLTQLRAAAYEGVAIADALARRGYIVAVIDSFYFGERRIVVPPPSALQQEFLLAAEGSDQWLQLVDRVSAQMESVVARSLFWAGATWPGVLAGDDVRTVDFLLTLPEVDAARIGCVGLSMGGQRAALLGALDPRVKAVCIVGWMSTLVDMLEEHVADHSWCNPIPGLPGLLDWPDVASLHAPDPLLVMQGSQDPAFPLHGYQKAAERLRAIYAKAGVPGMLDIGLFDVPHTFNLEMQRQAWEFFDNAFAADG